MSNIINYRKIAFIFFVSAIFAPGLVSAATTSVTLAQSKSAILDLSPQTSSVTVNDIFSVSILLDTKGNAVDGVDIVYLNYNPALLEIQDDDSSAAGVQISKGSLMANTLLNTVDTASGKISFSQVADASSYYNGAGTLATARFKALAAGTAPVTFDFVSGSTADTNVASDGVDILTAVTNGTYTITAGGSSGETTSGGTTSGGTSGTTSSGGTTSGGTTSSGGTTAPTIAPAVPTTTTQPATTDTTQMPAQTTQPIPPITAAPQQSLHLPSGVSEGSLVRGPDGIKVYIVNYHGYRRHIFNPAIFNMYGHFKWDQIKTLDQQTLDSIKTSDFYRADGDTRVFSLKEIDEAKGLAQKRWMNIAGEKFTQLGYKWEQVFIINSKERDYYQEGTPLSEQELADNIQQATTPKTQQTQLPAIKISSGMLVKSPDGPTVYYITPALLKKPILSIEVFNSYNNQWANVKAISQQQLDSIPSVNAIRLIGSTKVYLLENNTKRWVKTQDAFYRLNLDWSKIAQVNQAELSAYQEGSAIE